MLCVEFYQGVANCVLFLLARLSLFLKEPKHGAFIVVRKLILLCLIFQERSRPVTVHVLNEK